MSAENSLDLLAMSIPCARCEAKPFESCRTISGRSAPVHTARTVPIYKAWHIGWDEAHAEHLQPPTEERA